MKRFLILFMLAGSVQASCLLSTYRVVFDDANLNRKIVLQNTGKKTQKYTISFESMLQGASGTYKKISKDVKDFYVAVPYLSVNEKSFVLEPNEEKKITLSVAQSIPNGEYVSYFSVLEEEMDGGASENKGFVIKGTLTTNIPIIVRRGLLTAEIDIISAKLSSKSQLEITLKRQGNKSVKGTLFVFKDSEKIAQMGNVKLYTNLEKLTLPVSIPETKELLKTGDEIKVSFSANEEDGQGLEIRKVFRLK